jgi:hypothetical protein
MLPQHHLEPHDPRRGSAQDPEWKHLTIGTFNCENLFARYRFRAGLEPTASDS